MKKTTGGKPTNPQREFPLGEDGVDSGQTSRETNSIQETGGKGYSPIVTSVGEKKRTISSSEKSSESTNVTGSQPDVQPQGAVGGTEIVTSAAKANRIKMSASGETENKGKKPDETLQKVQASGNVSSNQQTESQAEKEAKIIDDAKKSCLENRCTEEEADKGIERLKKKEELDG